MKLEDIKIDAQVRGIQADEIVRIVQVAPVGEAAVTVYYKDSQGAVSEQMLFRSDEARLELAVAGRPWSFDAPGAEFKLGLEAFRITQAGLFDPMMAVHTSNVDPYPHQISAVTDDDCLYTNRYLSVAVLRPNAPIKHKAARVEIPQEGSCTKSIPC